MTHHVQSLLDGRSGIPTTQSAAWAVNSTEAASLRHALQNDCVGFAYCAVTSFSDSIRSLQNHSFTWATIKLYYTVYYVARTLVGLEGLTIFYVGKKPFRLRARAGETPQKAQGKTSHDVTFKCFREELPSHFLLSQEIGGEDPLNWLTLRREEMNYRTPRFPDPDPPKHLQWVKEHGVRDALNAYLTDTTHLYTFDSDHAIVAFPLHALRIAVTKVRNIHDPWLSDRERAFVARLLKDSSGPLKGAQDSVLSGT